MDFHLHFYWLYMAIITNFISLPKFAQIPNWWRHRRRSVDFQSPRLIFLDSASIFTSETVALYFHWQSIFVFLQFFLHKVIILESSYFTLFSPVTSSSELSSKDQFLAWKTAQLWTSITLSKKIFFWCGFFCSSGNFE